MAFIYVRNLWSIFFSKREIVKTKCLVRIFLCLFTRYWASVSIMSMSWTLCSGAHVHLISALFWCTCQCHECVVLSPWPHCFVPHSHDMYMLYWPPTLCPCREHVVLASCTCCTGPHVDAVNMLYWPTCPCHVLDVLAPMSMPWTCSGPHVHVVKMLFWLPCPCREHVVLTPTSMSWTCCSHPHVHVTYAWRGNVRLATVAHSRRSA